MSRSLGFGVASIRGRNLSMRCRRALADASFDHVPDIEVDPGELDIGAHVEVVYAVDQ